MKILITGGNGYIAKKLKKHLEDNHEVTTVTRDDFDLTDSISVNKWFDTRSYDAVIHTAISGGSRLVEEDYTVIDKNLSMYYNLHDNRHSFDKFISFGSGAEVFKQNTPYGMSKKIISESVKTTEGFYNIRIFGVFDEDELNTRFIKGNILRYLKKEPMIIHSDKIMDFIYMKDLMQIVNYYVGGKDLQKNINCSYQKKHTLKEIADFINTLDDYQVPIQIQCQNKFDFYCGSGYNLPIPTIGLHQGIINTFNELKNYERV